MALFKKGGKVPVDKMTERVNTLENKVAGLETEIIQLKCSHNNIDFIETSSIYSIGRKICLDCKKTIRSYVVHSGRNDYPDFLKDKATHLEETAKGLRTEIEQYNK